MMLITYGTRPEYIKVKPLIDEFMRNGVKVKLLYVRQHDDIKRFDNYRPYEIKIPEGGNRLDAIVYGVMSTGLWRAMDDVDTVLVQGDTTTALAVALSAFHNGKKVIHLEAGLRSFDKDNPWPEESNRRMISALADVHLCPTKEDASNLEIEEVSGDIYVTGNTIIDSLVGYKDQCEYGNVVVVTMHRRENHPVMRQWFMEIEKLARDNRDFEFILPLHPNPDVRKHKDVFDVVNVFDSLSHHEFLQFLIRAKMVITDSGGLQEECSYFNKKCLVCRKVTERRSSLGQSSFIVPNPESLADVFYLHVNDYKIDFDCPFGDGSSSQGIFKILRDL